MSSKWFRIFLLTRRLRYVYHAGLLLIINAIVFFILPKIISTNRETSKYLKFEEQSYIQYFQSKEQQIKESDFRIRIPHQRQISSEKTSFLIYEFPKYRHFCNKQVQSIYSRNCPYQNCKFTCDPSLNRTSDALFMLYTRLDHRQLSSLFEQRNPNQIWVLWYDEPYSPSSIYNRFFFNWTMSYRLDSEISVSSYGTTVIRDQSMARPEFNRWIDEHFHKRLIQAAWFVSNCRPRARLQYYHQLKQYFPIFAVGKCILNRTCARFSNCEKEKLSNLKFYLAFESVSTKSNYITEKFWRALYHGAIPVVLGPKRQDYERVAPPHSFIYAKDFQTPQLLAEHLHQISTDRIQYQYYHQWRIDYNAYYLRKDVESVRFCEFCYKLNTNRDRIWYTNVNKYFS